MHGMPISKLRNSVKKDVKLFLCLAVAGLVGFVPAYAGGITDILVSVFGFFILVITKGIVWVLEMLSNLFLGAMSVDVNTLISNGYLKGFETFAEGIRIVATGIALAIVMWQLFVVLWGPLIGAQQTQSVMAIVMRGLIFVPLTYFIQPLALGVLKQFQSVYNAFLSVYNANPDGVFGVRLLSDYINPDTFMSDLGISGSNIIETTIQDILGTAMACIMIAVITWQFIKLLLELAQRFVAMLFYVYLSPLAAACGVGANSIQITKSALTLFVSSGVLWVLNVWSVSVCLGLFSAVDTAVGSGASGFFLWSVLTYGALKIAQQLDDIFNAVGATNVRLSGSLLDDIVSMTKMSEWAGKMYGGAQDALNKFAENGLGGAGKDPDKPVGPDGQGSAANRIPNNAMATAADQNKTTVQAGTTNAQAGQKNTPNVATAANGMKAPVAKTAADGSPARSLGQQAGAKAMDIAGRTAAGRFVRGVKKTGENLSTRVNAGVAEAQVAADNRAMNRMHGALSQDSAENRAKAMTQLAQNHPDDLKNQAVKDYLGENMGLAENQQVASMSIDKNGQLSAMVATNNGDGSITMSKVDGINDMTFGQNANHSAGQGAQATSAGGTTVSGGSAASGGNAISAGANGSGGSGMTSVPQGAQISYKDLEGNSRTASVMKNEGSGTIKDGKPVASFSVIPDDGGSPVTISAPANMSEQDVASLVANKATPEVQDHFKQGGNEMQLAGSAARLSLDDSAPRSVNVGGSAAGGNIATSDSAHSVDGGMTQIRYSDTSGNAHTASVMRESGSETMQDGKQMATFTVTPDNGGNSVSISAPASMSEQEVGAMVTNTASSDVQTHFSQGGDTSQLASSVAGLNIDNSAPRSVETSEPAAVGGGSASASHETTQINYSGYDGNAHTASVMREAGSETMRDGKEMATFTVTPDNGGSSVNITAPASMTEQEVGSLVANSASSDVTQRFEQGGGSMSQVRDTTSHLDLNDSADRSVETSHVSSTQSVSSNAVHSVADSVTTAHNDGTMWTQEFTAQANESPIDPGHSDLQFSYAQQQANGASVPAAGFVKYEATGPDGQVQYQYGANNEVKGTITLDKNITAEELSALLMQKDGGGQAAVQEIRKNLGFAKEYSKPEADGFRDAMDKAKRMKKGVATSEEAPIKADKK